MSRFRYEPTTHQYFIGDSEVVSVTKAISNGGLSVDYSAADPSVLAHARDRGLYVESCCALWDQGRLNLDAVVEEARGYVDAWMRFCDERRFNAKEHQIALFHPELQYGGTADVMGWIGNGPGAEIYGLLDIKCTSSLSPSYRLQTVAYALPGLYGLDESPRVPCPVRGVVQLKRDGRFVYERHDDPHDADVFRAALTITKWKST